MISRHNTTSALDIVTIVAPSQFVTTTTTTTTTTLIDSFDKPVKNRCKSFPSNSLAERPIPGTEQNISIGAFPSEHFHLAALAPHFHPLPRIVGWVGRQPT